MTEREERLDQAIAYYYESREKGAPLSREDLLARYPDLTVELGAFLDDKAAFERQAGSPLAGATIGYEIPAPQEGQRLHYFGDYEILDQISRGGMGVVFRARQVSLNRPVALKMILAGQLASEQDVQRFKTEAEAAANLDHPNILPIYEVGEYQGQQYFSMKLVSTVSRSSLSQEEAAKLVATVARAVHHAHQRGILHRDLKPANILIDQDGTPYVSDFGLAKRVEGDSALTHTGAVVGTPSYMSPEQARAEKRLSTAVDVYSLGAILYEYLTDQPPFLGATTLETILQVRDCEPTPPRSLRPDIDRDLETICLKCLRKRPEDRYDSATSLADDLDRWERGEPILARPVPGWEKAILWTRRRPAIAALTAALALVAIAGFSGVVWQWREAIVARQRESARAESETAAREEADEARDEAANFAASATEARIDAERNLYLQQIALARQAWEASNILRLRELLEQTPKEYRGWEWGHLRRVAHSDLRTIPTGARCNSLAFRPGGAILAAGGGDGADVMLLDPATGKEIRRIATKTSYVTRLGWSPDGKHLAVGVTLPEVKRSLIDTFMGIAKGKHLDEGRGRMHLYDAETGTLVRMLGGALPIIRSLAFAPDGKLVVVGCGDNAVYFLEVAGGKVVRKLEGHGGDVRDVAFSPDGKRAASVAGEWYREAELKVWEVDTGKAALQPESAGAGGQSVAWSPDGRWLATGDSAHLIRVLDAAKGRVVHTLTGHRGPVTSLAFHPDGRTLASGSTDQTVRLWDHERGRSLGVLRGHEGGVEAVAYSPRGRLLASCSQVLNTVPRQSSDIKLWDASREQDDAIVLQQDSGTRGNVVNAAARQLSQLTGREAQFDPAGRQIRLPLVGGQVLTFDDRTGQLLTESDFVGVTFGSAFRPDGRQIALSRLRFGERDVLKIAGKVKASPQDEPAFMLGMASQILTEGAAELSLRDTATGKIAVELEEPMCWPAAPAYSPDGLLVAARSPQLIKVWDARTGKLRHRLPAFAGHMPGKLQFSPNGKWLTVVSGRPTKLGQVRGEKDVPALAVTVWDVATGKLKHRYTPDCTNPFPLAYSPDSGRLVLPGNGTAIELRETESGRLVATLAGHQQQALLAAYSPGGRLLATAGWDGLLHLWEAKTGKLVHRIQGHTRPIQGLAFHPDGKRIVTSSHIVTAVVNRSQDAGEVKLWDIESGRELLTMEGMGQLAFSPDGTKLVATGQGFSCRLWSSDPPTDADQALRREVWEKSAQSWHQIAAKRAEDDKHSYAHIFHLSRLIEAEPANARLYELRGRAYADQDRHAEAWADYDRVIRLRPKPGAVWYTRRGWMSLNLEQIDRAISDLSEAIAREPLRELARSLRANAWMQRGEWRRAVEDLNVAILLDPRDRTYRVMRGRAFASQNRWADADAEFAATRFDPSYRDLREEHALVRLALGDEASYRGHLGQMLRAGDGKSGADVFNQAFAAVRLPGVLPAETLLRLALRATEPDAKLKTKRDEAEQAMLLGAAFYRAGLYESARDRLLEAEKKRGKEPSAIDALFLALCYHRLGEPGRAAEALERGRRQFAEGEKAGTLNWGQRATRQALIREIEATEKSAP